MGASAQTITVSAIDPGPYGQGSTIAVPFHTTGGACIQQNNKFNLYLSDASGNFTSGGKLIGSYTGFYITFINGTIPAGTPAGAGYKVMIKSTSPIVTSAASAAFTISADPAVKAAISSVPFDPMKYPEVFGQCNGTDNNPFVFTNKSTPATATVTATFFNESTQAFEGGAPAISAIGYTFNAKATNYTVVAKATDGGIVSTKAYQLINNVINSNIGNSGEPPVCLYQGSATSTFNVDVHTKTGIQNNYPGNTYVVQWGDGTQTVYTLCDIQATDGKISHEYKKSSCGITSNNIANSFEIDLQPSSPYCGLSTKSSTYVKILLKPINKITGPQVVCTGSMPVYTNASSPGPDPNSNISTCADNPNAQYEWLIDGVHAAYLKLSERFTLPANTPAGSHIITLRLLNGYCGAEDFPYPVCIQNPPKLNFNFTDNTICLNNGPVTPNNTSVIDANCNTDNVYTWIVTGPAGANPVTYAGGTNANSSKPQFVFSTVGTYSVQLSITTASCGTVTGPTQTIVVNDAPLTKLSADVPLCGNGQTLSFDNNPGPTQTTLSGTIVQQPDTYSWTVTGGAYSFQNGTDAHSKYPQILFNDYAKYTITIAQKNNCGTTTATQHITFQQAPTVIAGTGPVTVCPLSPVVGLDGKITGTVGNYIWVGGTGTFSAGRNSLTGTYTPSAAEINAGQVILTLQATTTLAAPCDKIGSNLVINITPLDRVISKASKTICTGFPVAYDIQGSTQNSTFTWTASVTSGAATGVPATGSGSTINDVITNSSLTDQAVVTYVITPTGDLCPGTPFTFTVTVNPLPTITAAPQNSPICSNQPAAIILASNIANTSYTWTSTASAGITGNTNRTSAIVTNSISDILVNNGTTPGTVTYTIVPLNGTCSGQTIQATVTVQPLPVQSLPGNDDEICNATTYQLKGNSPLPGTGIWTVASGPAGITFSDKTDPHATVSGLIAGNTYQFTWTITASPTCPPSANSVTIVVDKPTVGGITAGGAPVCAGDNKGQVMLSGQSGKILRWESSTDNGATWQSIANTNTTQSYLNLTITTQYRAVVQSGSCDFMPSSATTITVNQPVPLAQIENVPPLCNQTSVTLTGNNPAPFSGVWSQTLGPQATIVSPNNYQTQVTGLASGNKYEFTWTIKGIPPCGDQSAVVDFTPAEDITPKFTEDRVQGCGPTTVTFANISTPNLNGTFLWDFGDGSSSSEVNTSHTFQPSADGSEADYTVTLTPISNCSLKTPATVHILVSPSHPVARITPSQTAACGSFSLTLTNTSPGDNVSYDYYMIDPAGTLLQHKTVFDKSDFTFDPVDPTRGTYSVYMIATDKCGNTYPSTSIPITVAPSDVRSYMQIKDAQQIFCLGSPVVLQNISSGGDRFNYSIYDASTDKLITTIPAGTGDLTYIPTVPGSYYATITAGTAGCGDAAPSPQQHFTVYAEPQPDFTFTGDDNYNITFNNTTADNGDNPASSLIYKWDFGDGSSTESTFVPNAHHYDFTRSPFTATLTATNPASNCFGIVKKTIVIKFLGGLFLPNAFMPNSTNRDLNTFKAKGTQLKEWSMQVFNSFGQLIWQTTKLDSNGSPVEGWDGTFKGAPAQQGVYIWQISATFLDGSKWKGMSYNNSLPKRTGVINLIR